jgi:hypothetical protein
MSTKKPPVVDAEDNDSWLRQNVIDVAPLWAQFIQTAFANVRIELNKRQPNGFDGSTLASLHLRDLDGSPALRMTEG